MKHNSYAMVWVWLVAVTACSSGDNGSPTDESPAPNAGKGGAQATGGAGGSGAAGGFSGGGGAAGGKEETADECSDGKDNDGDGKIDCTDPACKAVFGNTPLCDGSGGAGNGGAGAGGSPAGGAGGSPGGKEETADECADSKDNDGDGKTDCDDPTCKAAFGNTPLCSGSGGASVGGNGGTTAAGSGGGGKEETADECGDGKDNDGDGKTDCDDPTCKAVFGNTPLCAGAGGSTSAGAGGSAGGGSKEETADECGDGKDNDGDGKIDCTDPACIANFFQSLCAGSAGSSGAGGSGECLDPSCFSPCEIDECDPQGGGGSSGESGGACEQGLPAPFLPFPADQHMGVTRGPGCEGHTKQLAEAYDFTVNGNFESAHDMIAVAATAGTVTQVVSTVKGSCYDVATKQCNCGSAYNGGWGNCVIVNIDGSCVYERYCHLRTGGTLVKVGDHVCPGQPLGYIGTTGCSTGDHLHFQRETAGHQSIKVSFQDAVVPSGCSPCLTSTNTQGCYESKNVLSPNCSIPSSDPCSGKANGDYCGSSLQGYEGLPNDLVTCSGGKVASSKTCNDGCQVKPPGTNDVCSPPPAGCGNGKIDAGETCEGSDLGGQTCQSQGFNGGQLSCVGCQISTAGCCKNECAPGAKQCSGASTLQVCGNYDGDVCLEWGGDTSCPCSNGQCVDPCAGNNCNGHGTCSGGACTCTTGFDPATKCGSCASGYINYPSCSLDLCKGIVCGSPPGPCYASSGTCNPSNGQCTYAFKPGNTPCDDKNPCTQNDVCNGSGTCAGNGLVCTTPPNTQCWNQNGSCNGSGSCDYTPKPGNTPCNDGNACTQNDVCNGSGTCAGMQNTCNGHGTCSGGACACTTGFDPATECGSCASGYINYPTCSPDPCSGNNCNGHGTCSGGSCACTTGFEPSTQCGSCAPGYVNYPNCTKACSVTSSPGMGNPTGGVANTNCTCPGSGQSYCHSLYAATVTSISMTGPKGPQATISYSKLGGGTINAGTKYWIEPISSSVTPTCNQLNAYQPDRLTGTFPSSSSSQSLTVNIWPDQASYDNALPGDTKCLIFITDGSTTPNTKTWFQYQQTCFTKGC